MDERYYILPFLDGWSEVFHVVSQPLTGGSPQTYVVTGPGWSGTLPEGLKELKSPTGMVWVLGRIYSDGTEADYAKVHALQDAFDVRPLGAWGKACTPPRGRVDPSIDMRTAVRKQVNSLDAEAFFDRLAGLMVENPPHPEDKEMVARMPEDAIYPISLKDADGHEYDASKHDYVLRLEPGKMPPADAFWSLTIYDEDFFFIPNELNRFELSTRNRFVTGSDGAIDIYLQAESPGKEKEANWLPAPEGKFKLVLRLYDPSTKPPSILDGSWMPPPAKRVP